MAVFHHVVSLNSFDGGPGRAAQWARVSSRYTKVAGSIPSQQGTYKNQPVNAYVRQQISLSQINEYIDSCDGRKESLSRPAYVTNCYVRQSPSKIQLRVSFLKIKPKQDHS